MPELKDPSLLSVWGDYELFSLLYARKERPIETIQTYDGQHVVVRQRFRAITGNQVWLGGLYSHNEPIERELYVQCYISDIQDRHLPILAELRHMHDLAPRPDDYIQVTGTISRILVVEGGLTLYLDLADCEVTAIGNKIVG